MAIDRKDALFGDFINSAVMLICYIISLSDTIVVKICTHSLIALRRLMPVDQFILELGVLVALRVAMLTPSVDIIVSPASFYRVQNKTRRQ